MEIAGRFVPFDDRAVAREVLDAMIPLELDIVEPLGRV